MAFARDVPLGRPGAPVYDLVRDFGAAGNGAMDDTAPLNAAIAASVARPGVIYLPERIRTTGALSPLANNNIVLQGRGRFNCGTLWFLDLAAGQTGLTLTGQYCGLRDVWLAGSLAAADTVALRLSGYRCFAEGLLVTGFGGAIDVQNSVGVKVRNVVFGEMFGQWGCRVAGAGGFFTHDTFFEHCLGGQDFPLTNGGAGRGNWAQSTAYSLNDIVLANGVLWQCAVAGTSAGSGTGPSGIPTTNISFVHSTQVADGTVRWLYGMPHLSWWLHDSRAHSLSLAHCGALQGGRGLLVQDSAGSVPTFVKTHNFATDHVYTAGIEVSSGGAIDFTQNLHISTLAPTGDAIRLGSNVHGARITNTSIFGVGGAGVVVNGATDVQLIGLDIGAVSFATANTRDGIEVSGSASRFVVQGCTAGDTSPVASSARYGLSIAAGCDNYAVTGNVFVGNDTGGILNTPGTAATRAVTGNVGSVT